MRVRQLICLAAVLASLVACGGDRKAPFSHGATGGIEHQLVLQGGTSAPVHQGTTTEDLSIASKIGSHVAVAVVCEGGGYLQVAINEKHVNEVNCQSTYQTIINVGFSFAADTDPTVILMEPAKGQHWWAGISGPGGTPT